ncbi:Anti-repressor SinI [Alteribacillus persepolensis]|uniref:Anti-repressor SinI n=1 Tax=Alteribacillus persepolensis TaxID=568899 RepID=A0A1G8C3U3_9BACI|nr:anti-repressor SinI family protein [Alteribacillus persepolensis]SDH40177.1 Anti-repressor SinI [Alteribacillus persepolensis]
MLDKNRKQQNTEMFDAEWVYLMQQAKASGLKVEEVRDFLSNCHDKQKVSTEKR